MVNGGVVPTSNGLEKALIPALDSAVAAAAGNDDVRPVGW